MTTPQPDLPTTTAGETRLSSRIQAEAAMELEYLHREREKAAKASAAGPVTSQAEATWERLTDGGPESVPEVLRYSLMIAGAVESLGRELRELRERLAHVLTDGEPHVIPSPDDPLPPQSTLACRLSDTYHEVVELDRLTYDLRTRLGV